MITGLQTQQFVIVISTAEVICNAEQKARNCLQGIVKYQLQVQLQYWQTQHTQLTMCCSRHVSAHLH